MYRQMKGLSVMLVCASIFVPALAEAQQAAGPPAGVGPCGPLDEAGRLSLLEEYAPTFTSADEDLVDFRVQMGLEQVFAGDPLEAVSRPNECGKVVAEAFRILNRRILPGPPPITRDDMDWAVLRIGPYWVVPMTPRRSGSATVQGYADVLVFTVSGLKFVTSFLG